MPEDGVQASLRDLSKYRENLMTSEPGVFVDGVCVFARLIIDSVSDGKPAFTGIGEYLRR